MYRLQSLAKRKLEIDLGGVEQVRYWSRRRRLEEAYRDAYFLGNDETMKKTKAELLTFYILYGVRHAKKI